MNPTFDRDGLATLDRELLLHADRVVPMRDIWKGDSAPLTIGLRHDVDDNTGSFETALAMARWEFDRGYSSTYYLLHGSHYWDADNLMRALEFEELGHEVGIHVRAISESLKVRRSPEWILTEALGDLRSFGLRVDGFVAHGETNSQGSCYREDGTLEFVNDEMFTECRRDNLGDAVRWVTRGKTSVLIDPQPMRNYHLHYAANYLPREDYLSDSGKHWSQSFGAVVSRFRNGSGQLHVLLHPDWWADAFVGVTV